MATKSAQTYTTSASATTQVQGSGPGGPSPDLTIGKNGPLDRDAGGTITYTLTVNNLGNGNALGVKVTDTLPAPTITGVVGHEPVHLRSAAHRHHGRAPAAE